MLNLLLALVGSYVIVCFAARILHRNFVYMPDRTRVAPKDAGLPGVQEVELSAADGTKLIAWHLLPRGPKPTMLYFMGNAGNVAHRAGKIAAIAADGYGVLMLNYRRFGGSRGFPSETKNVADAAAAYDYLRGLGLDAKDIVAYGESLGTGVATQLALIRELKALVLESPFMSIADVGQKAWPFLPLRFVVGDNYRTIDRIDGVSVPLLIVHGARDIMIPVAQGRRVYNEANNPKKLVILPGAGHNDLFEHGAWDKVYEFVEDLQPKRARPELELVEGDVALRSFGSEAAAFEPEDIRPRASRPLKVG